jgi:geranylgeranyl diphosphate synthase type 3
MDLFWRDSLSCPTEEEYIQMVNNKTGGLLRLAVKLMQACSSSSTYPSLSTLFTKSSDYVPLVNLIGILFQIRDDYQNLQDTQYTHNKGLCEDITEGKFSFPIIHAILSRPDDRQLISIRSLWRCALT